MNDAMSDPTVIQSVGVHWPAILVAALAAWILGALWYGPLFGNAWMNGIGKTKEEVQRDYTPLKILYAFIGYFIAGYGIARLLSFTDGSTWLDGVHIAVLGAVCLVIFPMSVAELMEHRTPKLLLINAGYVIVTFAITGAIVGAWR
jgi:hypothetical protein